MDLDRQRNKELSERLTQDPKNALDVLTREELGLDPGALGGSPGTAAVTSCLLFAPGAAFPLMPFVIMRGNVALLVSVSESATVLFVIGAAISVIHGSFGRVVRYAAAPHRVGGVGGHVRHRSRSRRSRELRVAASTQQASPKRATIRGSRPCPRRRVRG